MGDVHAEHAPEALMDPTDPWGTLGAHVVEAKGARGARVGGGVSVVSLTEKNQQLWNAESPGVAFQSVKALHRCTQ